MFEGVVNGYNIDWIIQLTLLLLTQNNDKKKSEEGERETHGRVIRRETEHAHTKEYIYVLTTKGSRRESTCKTTPIISSTQTE